MQVDGEAVRVNPAVIEISFLNQAKMLVKRKGGSKVSVKFKARSGLYRRLFLLCSFHFSWFINLENRCNFFLFQNFINLFPLCPTDDRH